MLSAEQLKIKQIKAIEKHNKEIEKNNRIEQAEIDKKYDAIISNFKQKFDTYHADSTFTIAAKERYNGHNILSNGNCGAFEEVAKRMKNNYKGFLVKNTKNGNETCNLSAFWSYNT